MLAQPSATVVSIGQLPACFESIQMRELYPRMKNKNACGFAVEVLWCWKAVPSGWVKPSAMLEVQKVCRVGNGPNPQACK